MRAFVCMVALLLVSALASADVIFFEGFEGGVNKDVIKAPDVIAGTQFKVIAGNVDHIKPGVGNVYEVMCLNGTSCIDLTGSSVHTAGVRGAIETIDEIVLEPGEYYLRFSLNAWKDHNGLNSWAEIQVKFGEFVLETLLRNSANNPYHPESFMFTVDTPTSAKLSFTDLRGQYKFAGAILDNVEIGRVGIPADESVPEPATALMLLPALGAFLVLRKRARRTA